MSNLIPSATAIVLHQESSVDGFNVLLLKRNAKLKTHGGSWVFPGGKIDRGDYSGQTEDFYSLGHEQKLQAAMYAACRETREEAGIQLTEGALKLCSTWLTPPTMPKRFDAWFFITEIRSKAVKIDDGEIHDYQWIRPEEALQKQRNGELTLPPPTYVSLCYLAKYSSARLAFTEMGNNPIHYQPKLVPIDGGFCSLYEDDAGYDSLDLDEPGTQHRLIMKHGQFSYLKST